MPAAKLELKGVEAVQAKLADVGQRYPAAFVDAVYQWGTEIARDAQSRAPGGVGGDLAQSVYVTKPTGAGSAVVEVGFGALYAPEQHERLDYHHPRGGSAKFLENAYLSSKGATGVASTTKQNAEGGGSSSSGGIPTYPRFSGRGRRLASLGRAARLSKR